MSRRTLFLILTFFVAAQAQAFCGFYVAKGDAKLFNRASQVVIVRDQDRTVMTMANDFQGSVRDFAVVIPVPTKIERGQIHVAKKALIDHLDAYSSPRLVEYFDPDPCSPAPPVAMAAPSMSESITVSKSRKRDDALGVTIEAKSPSASTTFSSFPPHRAPAWPHGSLKAAIRCRRVPRMCWGAISARACISSWRR